MGDGGGGSGVSISCDAVEGGGRPGARVGGATASGEGSLLYKHRLRTPCSVQFHECLSREAVRVPVVPRARLRSPFSLRLFGTVWKIRLETRHREGEASLKVSPSGQGKGGRRTPEKTPNSAPHHVQRDCRRRVLSPVFRHSRLA